MKSFALIAGACFAVLLGTSAQNAIAAPTVSITSPTANKNFGAPATIAITASATPSAGTTISKVDFRRGTTLLGTKTAPPYTYTWTNAAIGNYSLTAKATDSTGATKTSAAVAITVKANVKPTVSITAPANNAVYSPPASIVITANASDSDGTVSKVDFYRGATLLGSKTAAPYTYTWNNVASASYSLTAKATDNSGGVTTSSAVAVTVTTAPPTPPTVSLTAPANNASYSAPALIAITATATPATGATISKVEFFNGATLLSSDTASPYSYTWRNVAAGTYSLTAKATDSKSATTTTPAVTVTVNIPSPPPTVSITSPTSGATFTGPGNIPITATAAATAPGATINRVDFYNGATLLGTSSSPPYTFNWTNVPAGGFLLTAKATDSLGTTGTSALTYAIVDGADSCASSPPLAAADASTKFAGLGKLPMAFEVNAGQANPDVLFQARGAGYRFFLTPNERVLALQSTPQSSSGVAVRARFVGANPQPLVTGVDPVEQKSNYLVGSDSASWRTNVPHFAKVRYEALYPGIDELYYGSEGILEYDLHVAPGANPRAIRFAIDGVDKLSIDRNGDLLLKTSLGTLVQKQPLAYQEINGERRAVSARYQMLVGNEVTFKIGKYDSRYSLVIDPVLVYSTYLGGTNNGSGANAIALSRCGEAFIVGWTVATDYPTTAGAFDTSAVPGTQMGFVSKLNQTGTGLLYSTYVTGSVPQSQSSTVNAIAVDATGHAYIAGETSATDFPTTPGSLNPSAPSSTFAAKLNTDGSAFLYATYMPANSIAGIAADNAGSAYVTGGTEVWKLNPAGSGLMYSFAVGGDPGYSFARAIAVDSAGNAYVAGTLYTGILAVTTGAFQVARPNVGLQTGFVAKINLTGTALVYGTYLGTTSNIDITGLAIDTSGNAYIGGVADNGASIPNFTGIYTSFAIALAGNEYAFATKLSADGSSLEYFSRIGGPICLPGYVSCSAATTRAKAIDVDQAGNAWITGTTTSNQVPLVKALYYAFSSGPPNYGTDIFIAKFSPAGNGLPFSTLLGGELTGYSPSPASSSGIKVDSTGTAYATGWTDKLAFPTTAGAFQPVVPGPGCNAFVVKINENKDTYTALAVTPSPGEVGAAITLTASITGNAPTGTVTFQDSSTTLGTVSVIDASAQLTTSQLAGGTHSLTATYNGDVHNRPSTSNPFSLNISDPTGLPTVSLTGITDGAWFVTNSGSTLINKVVTATASAAAGNILQQVRIIYKTGSTFWNLGGLNAQTDIEILTLPAMSPGFYTVAATATDNYAHSVSTAPIRFTVNPTTASPSAVAITAPVNGASYAAQSSIVLTASATAAGSATISYIEFYQGSTWIGSDNTSPYAITWNNVPPGTYSLIAIATDSASGKTLSTPITITVIAPPPPPAVAITSPANNASFTTPVNIPITASATPATGATISKVDFYDGAALLGTVTASPYTYTWTTVPAGSHSLTAKATDSRGATATTTAVSVTVTSPTPPPAISLTSPASGATFDNSTTIPLAATASTTAGTIAKIEFFDGATLLGTVSGSASALSATFDYGNASVGSHAISAKATTSDGTVNTTPANTITVTSSVVVVLTSPADGAAYVTGQSVAMNAMAFSGTQTIARIDFYVDNVLVGTGAIGAAQGTATATWVATAGVHTLSARAVTSANFTTASADSAITVNNLGITLTEPSMGQNYIAPGSVRVSALAPVAAGSSVARVEFFNGATKLGEATAAPYSILWSNVAAGSYSVSAKATDAQGFSIESAAATINVIAAPAIFASNGLDGSTVADSSANIAGTVQTPLNSAVTVNGVPAVITSDGQFFVNGLPLDAGPNTLVINVMTADGVSSSQTITVHGSGPSPFKFEVDRSSGIAPLTANFTVSNPGNAAFDKIELDFQNDGIADLILTALPAPETISLLFPGPGMGRVTMKVKDLAGNVIFAKTILVYVYAATERYNLIKGVYTGMVERLKAGNIDGASSFFTEARRPQYQAFFTALGGDLSTIANQLGTLKGGTFSDGFGELIIARDTPDGPTGFPILIIRDLDGIWRIAGM